MQYLEYKLTNEFAETVEVAVDKSYGWEAIYKGVIVTKMISDDDFYAIDALVDAEYDLSVQRMMQREGSGYRVY